MSDNPHSNPPAAPVVRAEHASARWSLRDLIVNAAVLGALGAIAWWGHHSGWKLPKFSELAGTTAHDADWCTEHSVPEDACVICRKDIWPLPKSHGWCKVHGVADCPLEHPDVAQLKDPAKVDSADLERAARGLAVMERKANNSRCKLHERPIQFANVEAADKAGIEVAPVWRAPVVESISAHGELDYNHYRLFHLTVRSPGVILSGHKHIGDTVKKGDVLAMIDSPQLAKLKASIIQAAVQADLRGRTLARMKASGGAVPERMVLEAEGEVTEARIALTTSLQEIVNLGLPVSAEQLTGRTPEELTNDMRFLGLPSDAIRGLDPATASTGLLPLRSPLDGTIVSGHVVPGESVREGDAVFTVANLEDMWLTLHVRAEDARYVRMGQTVQFSADHETAPHTGRIDLVSTGLDEKTRTLEVRATLDNKDGKLRAKSFGTGQIVLRDEPEAIVVPTSAIEWEGDCHVVFVRNKDYLKPESPKLFHVRKVRLGAKTGDQTEILAGVLPGELVVSKGSAVLRAELLRGNLGAGCCGHEH